MLDEGSGRSAGDLVEECRVRWTRLECNDGGVFLRSFPTYSRVWRVTCSAYFLENIKSFLHCSGSFGLAI